MYHNDDNRGVAAECHWRLDRQWARAGKSLVRESFLAPNGSRERILGTARTARRADRGPLFLKKVWWSARLITCGMVLQASGCTFDSNAFFGDSLAAIFDNVAATLIITTLSDLLGVAPSFAF